MRELARVAKALSVVLLTLSVLLNVVLGIVAVYVILIARYIRQLPALRTTGTRVMATVTGIKTRRTHTYTFDGSAKPTRSTRNIYFLIARWRHPETGKTYTFRSLVRDESTYPVGSSVAFLVDYDHPRRHLMANIGEEFKRAGDTTQVPEE